MNEGGKACGMAEAGATAAAPMQQQQQQRASFIEESAMPPRTVLHLSSEPLVPKPRMGGKARALWCSLSLEFRDALAYLLFFAVFCTTTFGSRSANPYFMADGIAGNIFESQFDLDTTYYDIGSAVSRIEMCWLDLMDLCMYGNQKTTRFLSSWLCAARPSSLCSSYLP